MNIVSLMLEEVNSLLAKQKLHIEVPTEVKEKLVDLGYDPQWALVLTSNNSRTN